MSDTDPLRELVDASVVIYHWAGEKFRGSRRQPSLATETDSEERNRFLQRFWLALADAKETNVTNVVKFGEWHERTERLRDVAQRNADSNAHWTNIKHRNLLQGQYAGGGDTQDKIRADAKGWFSSIQRDLLNEIRWLSDLRLQLNARDELEPKAPEGLTDNQKRVWDLVVATGHRMKTRQILDALNASGMPIGDSAIKQHLATFTKRLKVWDNRQPGGYGFPEWPANPES